MSEPMRVLMNPNDVPTRRREYAPSMLNPLSLNLKADDLPLAPARSARAG